MNKDLPSKVIIKDTGPVLDQGSLASSTACSLSLRDINILKLKDTERFINQMYSYYNEETLESDVESVQKQIASLSIKKKDQ